MLSHCVTCPWPQYGVDFALVTLDHYQRTMQETVLQKCRPISIEYLQEMSIYLPCNIFILRVMKLYRSHDKFELFEGTIASGNS